MIPVYSEFSSDRFHCIIKLQRQNKIPKQLQRLQVLSVIWLFCVYCHLLWNQGFIWFASPNTTVKKRD